MTNIGKNIPPGAPDENENNENKYFAMNKTNKTPKDGTATIGKMTGGTL